MKKSLLFLFTSIMSLSVVFAQEDAEEDIFEMSLEELLNVEVFSVSKKAERLQDAATSIYVLTSDDIMKSGATTLHEVLRNVPGYWATQYEYNDLRSAMRYSSAENDINGTMLYLLDGTPLQDLMASSFTFRNFDLPLEQIDRIEVIRGSGGTVYGANAATGVVNIYTKNPEDTEKLLVRAEGAAPGYAGVSVNAGGQISDNFALSGYAKVRYFSGYGAFEGEDLDGNVVANPSRFTEDYEASTMISGGLKMGLALGEKTNLSFRSHYNTLSKTEYTNAYEQDALDLTTQTLSNDRLFENDVNASRLTANVKLDQEFNENHSLFVRVSTNTENDFIRLGGGFRVNNSIIDFEVQDNLSLGSFNDLSVGANYRLVNFDISDVNSPTTINFIDPQASESLKGAFIQDRLRLFDDRLSIIAGIKTENYSLVNDKFYLSPSLKVSFAPIPQLTVWGGFTQAYTTPGFFNTNADLFLFQTPTEEAWTQAATAGVYQAVYDDAISNGATPEQADQAANDFLASDLGPVAVEQVASGLIANNPSFAVQNGSETVPTRYQTYEFGVRANLKERFQIETNLFYNDITDGISVLDLNSVARFQESPTQPGRGAIYYLYGNYTQGSSLGAESMFRATISQNLKFELSHSWLQTELEYQENEDFDIDDLTEEELNQSPEVSFVPMNVFRGRVDYSFLETFNVSASVIYAGEYNIESSYRFDDERYENIVSADLELSPSTPIENIDSRTIINLRLEKSFGDNAFNVYVFGNDIFNKGEIAQTFQPGNVTISRIGAMFGAGLTYNLK